MNAENIEQPAKKSDWLTKFMAVRCERCFLCQHARKNPGTFFGKFMQWHGTWCPFWKAREKVYGA